MSCQQPGAVHCAGMCGTEGHCLTLGCRVCGTIAARQFLPHWGDDAGFSDAAWLVKKVSTLFRYTDTSDSHLQFHFVGKWTTLDDLRIKDGNLSAEAFALVSEEMAAWLRKTVVDALFARTQKGGAASLGDLVSATNPPISGPQSGFILSACFWFFANLALDGRYPGELTFIDSQELEDALSILEELPDLEQVAFKLGYVVGFSGKHLEPEATPPFVVLVCSSGTPGLVCCDSTYATVPTHLVQRR